MLRPFGESVEGRPRGALRMRMPQGLAIVRAAGPNAEPEPGRGTAQGVEVEAIGRLRVGG